MNAANPSLVPVVSRRTVIGAAGVALFVPLLFAGYTGQVWEDYYITFRSSRNLAEGHGLVYQVGETVHTFTSPLGALLPALGFALTGNDDATLWFFRIISALALAGTAALVVNHARDQAWSRGACWLALCLGVFEAKTVSFSANGMETALLVLFTALTWHELTRAGGLRWPLLATGYGGLMWTRPDAFIPAAAMTLAWWIFGPRTLGGEESLWWRRLGAALVVGGLLYAPWFFGAWHYYGSPVPQTIIAKSALSPGLSFGRILTAPLSCIVDNTPLDGLFAPIYPKFGGWPQGFLLLCRLLARLSAFLWLVPILPRATRAASLAVLIGGIYFNQVPSFPWYYAPWTLLGALALAGSAWTFLSLLSPRPRAVIRVLSGVLATGTLLVSCAQAYAARQQQQIIENNGRKQIGLWLRTHAAPHDTVFLEPIGYIGYFSQLKILDYPGLCAPEVSRIVRSGPGGYARIITTLKPGWLVLRPYEIASQNLKNSGVLDAYVPAKYWNQQPQVDALRFLPGRNWLEFDTEFIVYRRREPGDPPPGR